MASVGFKKFDPKIHNNAMGTENKSTSEKEFALLDAKEESIVLMGGLNTFLRNLSRKESGCCRIQSFGSWVFLGHGNTLSKECVSCVPKEGKKGEIKGEEEGYLVCL